MKRPGDKPGHTLKKTVLMQFNLDFEDFQPD